MKSKSSENLSSQYPIPERELILYVIIDYWLLIIDYYLLFLIN